MAESVANRQDFGQLGNTILRNGVLIIAVAIVGLYGSQALDIPVSKVGLTQAMDSGALLVVSLGAGIAIFGTVFRMMDSLGVLSDMFGRTLTPTLFLGLVLHCVAHLMALVWLALSVPDITTYPHEISGEPLISAVLLFPLFWGMLSVIVTKIRLTSLGTRVGESP